MAHFDWRRRMREGVVIPAHPLALTSARNVDERRQRALTRYYLDARAGGLAVGVHTTQFAIREHGLYRPVLAMAAEEMRGHDVIRIAGVCGPRPQAIREAECAAGGRPVLEMLTRLLGGDQVSIRNRYRDRVGGQLENSRDLPLGEIRQQHHFPIREFQRVMVRM